eukprot:TRINITY_DN62867_c0_g1_i1.p2 TRINITY_DN62867_c0_g1~~TRINITY_DN62867_c0_g1_i1.p2  ORF type:complete len:492 (+),score=57.80 TRINITY_DN62867_c0_g1_i1:33-1508(+)
MCTLPPVSPVSPDASEILPDHENESNQSILSPRAWQQLVVDEYRGREAVEDEESYERYNMRPPPKKVTVLCKLECCTNIERQLFKPILVQIPEDIDFNDLVDSVNERFGQPCELFYHPNFGHKSFNTKWIQQNPALPEVFKAAVMEQVRLKDDKYKPVQLTGATFHKFFETTLNYDEAYFKQHPANKQKHKSPSNKNKSAAKYKQEERVYMELLARPEPHFRGSPAGVLAYTATQKKLQQANSSCLSTTSTNMTTGSSKKGTSRTKSNLSSASQMQQEKLNTLYNKLNGLTQELHGPFKIKTITTDQVNKSVERLYEQPLKKIKARQEDFDAQTTFQRNKRFYIKKCPRDLNEREEEAVGSLYDAAIEAHQTTMEELEGKYTLELPAPAQLSTEEQDEACYRMTYTAMEKRQRVRDAAHGKVWGKPESPRKLDPAHISVVADRLCGKAMEHRKATHERMAEKYTWQPPKGHKLNPDQMDAMVGRLAVGKEG